MSDHTSTWPSVFGPAPMPMVGMARLRVNSVAIPAGTISKTTAKAPAFSMASVSRRSASAPAPRPCMRGPPSVFSDWGV